MPKNVQTTTQLIASKVMLKILQARLQQWMYQELPDVQAWFRKGRWNRDQIANIHGIIEKARKFQKNTYFCFIDYTKAFDSVDHNKLWKILKELEFQTTRPTILFNLNVEHIMQNFGLDEAQARINISGRNINNLRYADDTTLMEESKEELKSFLIKVKEKSKKAGLKLNIQKTKIMTSGSITSWHIDGETVTDFIFLGSRITVDGDCSHEIKDTCSLEEKLWPA